MDQPSSGNVPEQRGRSGGSRKALLVVCGLVEGGTGLCLLVFPSLSLGLLLGPEAPMAKALTMGRVIGALLVAIGGLSWLAARDRREPSSLRAVASLLVYNTLAAAALAYAGGMLGLSGELLWPAVAVHLALAFWCQICLRGALRERDVAHDRP